MGPQTKYDLANQILGGRLGTELVKRRDRGDTWDDVMFWLRNRGVKVSRPTVMAWYRDVLAQQSA